MFTKIFLGIIGVLLIIIVVMGIIIKTQRYVNSHNAARITSLTDEKNTWKDGYTKIRKAVQEHEKHCDGPKILPDDDDDGGRRRIFPIFRDGELTFEYRSE